MLPSRPSASVRWVVVGVRRPFGRRRCVACLGHANQATGGELAMVAAATFL